MKTILEMTPCRFLMTCLVATASVTSGHSASNAWKADDFKVILNASPVSLLPCEPVEAYVRITNISTNDHVVSLNWLATYLYSRDSGATWTTLIPYGYIPTPPIPKPRKIKINESLWDWAVLDVDREGTPLFLNPGIYLIKSVSEK